MNLRHGKTVEQTVRMYHAKTKTCSSCQLQALLDCLGLLDDWPVWIGDVLLQTRINAGLSKDTLANAIGYSPSHIGRCEMGIDIPSSEMLETILEKTIILKREGRQESCFCCRNIRLPSR